ncbi:hypothetical protein M758_12G107400 [Ceratodon purpureus]|nr:hypothetical protein M758_12G107400 [Ceratodon purpureus]
MAPSNTLNATCSILVTVLMKSLMVLAEVHCGQQIMRLQVSSVGIIQKAQLRLHRLWMCLFQAATHWKLSID